MHIFDKISISMLRTNIKYTLFAFALTEIKGITLAWHRN